MSDYFYWYKELSDLPKEVRPLWDDYADFFRAAPGSKSKHQAWPGGYLDHIKEMNMLAEDFYNVMDKRRKLPFILSDAKLVNFLHHLEKPFKYASESLAKREPELVELAKENPEDLKQKLIDRYNIPVTDYQRNALKYVHGEGDDYSDKRVGNELATFVHMCDMASARIWYDYPGYRSL